MANEPHHLGLVAGCHAELQQMHYHKSVAPDNMALV
jgi:hypothetical protein